jgi:hypothetical protein
VVAKKSSAKRTGTATKKSTGAAGKKTSSKPARQRASGISNRMSAKDEARGQQQHPRLDAGSPPVEDAAGRKGERQVADRGRQTSHKAGSRSIAQKEANTRYPDRSMPAARKTAGAFGREPGRSSEARARAGTSRPKRKRG